MRIVNSLFSINPVSLTLGTIVLVVMLFLSGAPILDLMELKSYDLRFLSRGQMQPSPAVVLALIDEKSLDTEGRWPWPRSKIAALVDRLSQDGASVIGFDVGFLEPDENSQLAFLDQLDQTVEALDIKNPKLAEFLHESRKHADNDLALANALNNSSAAVVLGYFFHMSEADLNYRIAPNEIDQQLKRIRASKYPFIMYAEPEMDFVPFLTAYAPESNLNMFTEAADSSGYFSLRSDQDGTIRWMPLMIQVGEDLFPPLAISTAWHYLGKPQLTVKVGRYGVDGIKMGNQFIPTNENGQLLINYLGPPKIFPHISISDILNGKLPSGTFKDKIVLVGATATGIYDMRNTPFSAVYPGVEIHATVIDNILTQNFVTKPNWSTVFDVLAIILLGALSGIAVSRLGALGSGMSVALLLLASVAVNYVLFVVSGFWLNIVYPVLVTVAVFVGIMLYRYLVEEKDKRFLRKTFSSYLSPVLIEQMVQANTEPKLGGDSGIHTAYFTDIASFSSFSESLSATKLVQLLNEYLTAMTNILLAEDGTLDKYEGDALLAFFGAPLPMEDHATRALRTALRMQQELAHLREKWTAEGEKWPDLVKQMRMRIGVNAGEFVTGNMGSTTRMNYTMMGDVVNTAARLEASAKQYGIYIQCTSDTLTLAGPESFEWRTIDSVRVVGKTEPLNTVEIMAPKMGLSEKETLMRDIYHQGLALYRAQKWDEAKAKLAESERLEEMFTGRPTNPSRVLLERCDFFKANPPGENWDGVWTLTSK